MKNNQNKGERCCEKCEIIETFNESYCKNKDCCCHTPQSSTLDTTMEEIIEKLAMAITHSEQGEYAKNEQFVRNLISQLKDIKE